jgi:hypothetical protein
MKNDKETLSEGVVNQSSELMNLIGFDGSVSLDELYEIREIIEERLSDFTGGSSIEGNGVNFNFTYNEKPFHLRIKKDEFHWNYWMKNKLHFWKEKS